jgi:hypothetical protein
MTNVRAASVTNRLRRARPGHTRKETLMATKPPGKSQAKASSARPNAAATRSAPKAQGKKTAQSKPAATGMKGGAKKK